jgi:hypothetical protein
VGLAAHPHVNLMEIIMSKIYRILILFIILLIASTFPIESASSDTVAVSDIPNVAQLEMRVKQLCEADINGDWRTWYNLSTFSLKKVVPKEEVCSYEEFEKEFTRQRNDKVKILSCSINKITLKDKLNYNKPVAAVEMDVVIQELSKKPEKRKDQTDYWVYIDDTWYWTWRGFPHD